MSKLLTRSLPLLIAAILFAPLARSSDHDAHNVRLRPRTAPNDLKRTCSFYLGKLADTNSYHPGARVGWTPKDESGSTAKFEQDRKAIVAEARAKVFFGANPFKKIGQGGEGVLFAGKDPRTGEEVVVKFSLVDSKSKDDYFPLQDVPRLIAKAQKVDHPGKAYLLPWARTGTDLFSKENGDYLVMPNIRGEAMADALKKMSPEQRQKALLQMADALEAVQVAGISHSDVKESNFLWVDNHPVLVDWNLSRPIGETKPGLVGTLNYMEIPEKLNKEAVSTTVSSKRDGYSLAVVIANQAEQSADTYAPVQALPKMLRPKYVEAQSDDQKIYYAAIGSIRSLVNDVGELKRALSDIPSSPAGEAAWYQQYIFRPVLERAPSSEVMAGIIGSNPRASELFFSDRISLPPQTKKQIAQSILDLNQNSKARAKLPQAANYSPFIHPRSLEAAKSTVSPTVEITQVPAPIPFRNDFY